MSDKIKIFQLDDDSDQLKLFSKVCKKDDEFEHQGFLTTKDFLEKIKEEKPDICFIDINLSEGAGAGFMVVKALRNKYQDNFPIVILSRRGNKADISYGFEVGATDYILKPIDPMLIIEKIKTLINPQEKSAFPEREFSKKIPAQINVKAKLVKVDSNYFYLESDFYIKKHIEIPITHSLFKDIFDYSKMEFLVHDCNLDYDSGKYIVTLDPKKKSDDYFDAIQEYLKLKD
jgi:DNA-binding response OmpR family regulator